MSDELKYYMVSGKSDDYGACKREVVQTTAANAEEYYGHQEIEPQDVDVIAKFFDVIEYEEESERSSDRRYYGVE